MHRITQLIALACIALPFSALAETRLYLAQFDRSQWQIVAADSACHLRHEIPGFGNARITRNLDGDFSVSLLADIPPTTGGVANVISRNPAHWQTADERELQTTRIEANREAFHFSRHGAQRIVSELERGRIVSLRFEAWWHDGTAEVAISNTGFRKALNEHRECVAALHGNETTTANGDNEPQATDPLQVMGYEETPLPNLEANSPSETNENPNQRHEFVFETAEAHLSREARAELRRLAEELRNGGTWGEIVATAYSATSGSDQFNRELARQRAEAVRDYLTQLGIPRNQLRLRAYIAALTPDDEIMNGEHPSSRRVVVTIQ
ncbi:hypothetical protein CAI21_12470 [Alkalilimnicola ehrlichii]|uniref:OmpA-like domain-containing protein n=1 Tax=Alkalilimnicola ehrlichii TaxID=351052 RepID=A0A3E0X2T7_9GAMM|nr:OmpA family protein [Alkalilimnicola ehrlichii]RFA28381.1 hypothetical protein CAI21_12470 [Alkalilimnicola ehrlichii]RFA38554.1 hypothetical protein CAL65_04190 [Alkalilimnicola ehrlichii]